MIGAGAARRVAVLAADLRERVFAPSRGRGPAPPRIGVEVELIPVDAATRRICPIEGAGGPASLPLLRRLGERAGWIEKPCGRDAPGFHLPDGGKLSFEPGGQIEYSSSPCRSAAELLDRLRWLVPPLASRAAEEGIELLGTGIDPNNPVERVPLRLTGERYRRMADYFASLGPFGARMMRQSASVQVCLDFGPDPLLCWRVLNAAAPYLVAIFANSPVYAGEATGHRSYRAHIWRELDPSRTGILPADSPVAEYLEFALQAPAMLLGAGDGSWPPFREWLGAGRVGRADWLTHLSTLFPEVRPRGYLEVRSIDAIRPEWYSAPIALLAGITYDRASLHAAAELLGAPDSTLLRRAGIAGLGDPAIAGTARDLFEIGLRGAAALGPEFMAPADLEVATAFFERFTRRGRSPADEAEARGQANQSSAEQRD